MPLRVVEVPIFREWPFHGEVVDEDYFGQFVILSFDPLASVAALEDPTSRGAAAQLPRVKYLALVVSIAGSSSARLPNDDGEFKLGLEFWLIGNGLPVDHPTAAIPIFPASHHPTNRPAVHPTGGSLPSQWTDLYVHTLATFSAVVSRVHIGASPCDARLVESVVRGMKTTCTKDSDDSTKEERDLQAQQLRDADRERAARGDASLSERTPSISDVADSELKVVDEETEEIYRKLSQTAVFVEVWLDLTDQEGVSFEDVKEFAAPIPQLRRIWDEWEERMLAEKSAKQTSAWAEAAATAVHPNDLERDDKDIVHSDSVHPFVAELGDAAIAPEDAIDYKIEEARKERAATVSAPPMTTGSVMPQSSSARNSPLPRTDPGETEPPRVSSSGSPSPQPRSFISRGLSSLASRIRRLAGSAMRSK